MQYNKQILTLHIIYTKYIKEGKKEKVKQTNCGGR